MVFKWWNSCAETWNEGGFLCGSSSILFFGLRGGKNGAFRFCFLLKVAWRGWLGVGFPCYDVYIVEH